MSRRSGGWQAAKAGIAFEALDNGFASCEHPTRLQQICRRLTAAKIDVSLRKWLALLPHPFCRADRIAGYRYDLSMLQVEFSLTQMLDRPVSGRVLFEEVLRENLDLGRPDKIGLVFNRKADRVKLDSEKQDQIIKPSSWPVAGYAGFRRG